MSDFKAEINKLVMEGEKERISIEAEYARHKSSLPHAIAGIVCNRLRGGIKTEAKQSGFKNNGQITVSTNIGSVELRYDDIFMGCSKPIFADLYEDDNYWRIRLTDYGNPQYVPIFDIDIKAKKKLLSPGQKCSIICSLTVAGADILSEVQKELNEDSIHVRSYFLYEIKDIFARAPSNSAKEQIDRGKTTPFSFNLTSGGHLVVSLHFDASINK